MSYSFAFLVFSFEFCTAATRLDPSLKWKTLETPHFSIHFHDGLEEIAKRFAPMAEEVHEKLIPIIKHKPDLKTNVLLLDTADYGNGWATVFLDPEVTLYLTDWSTNLNPSKYDIWLKFLFTHEYTHILHLDIVEGGASLFKFLFGRVIFPNALEPEFIIEGLATYMETKHTQAGRGRDPRWDMMMRMDILEDNIKSIDQAAVNTVLWPMGHLRYIYGVEFLKYLAETYGEDKLITLTHIYGDFLFSYGIDGAFLFLYRKSLSMLWNEWLDHLREKYRKQRDGLGKLTEPKLITRFGYYNLKPKWSKDSNLIFYQQNNADVYPNIRAVDPKSGRDEKIFEGKVFANNLSLDPTGKKLLFSKFNTYKNYYSYRDLYIFDLGKRKLSRLTEGMRVGDADFSPEGSQIVFVKNEKGTQSLMIMGNDGSNPRLLCSYEANVQYFSPRWSPDGKRIAVAKWTPGGEQKIYLVDPETGKQERLTYEKDLTSEANPSFSPDGNYLFFDSDRTGIVNLYAYHLKSKRLFQVTNVLGGAMMPDVSPDGEKIAYVSYSSKGYDIAVMEVEPDEWKEVLETRTEAGNSKLKARSSIQHPALSIDTNIHDYNPIPTLLPKFWLPLNYYNENGVQTYIYTGGRDVLGQHYFEIKYGYDEKASRSQYNLVYVNNQFLPQMVLNLFDLAVPYSWYDETFWMRHRGENINFSLINKRIFYEYDWQTFTMGYEQINLSTISTKTTFATLPSTGSLKGVYLAWRYLNAREYAKSISPEDGIDLTLQVTMNSSGLGSDFTYTTYSGNLASYFGTPHKTSCLSSGFIWIL